MAALLGRTGTVEHRAGPSAVVTAAVAGTAAITLSQLLEMRLTGRPPSYTPAQTLAMLTGRPVPDGAQDRANWTAHLLFSANWSLAYAGLRRLTDRRGAAGAALLFAVVWPAEVAAGLRGGIFAPLRTWSRQDWAVDIGHKGVLALTTALAYEAALTPAQRSADS